MRRLLFLSTSISMLILPVGSGASSQLQANSYTTGNQRNAAVAIAPGGGFIVVWDSDGSPEPFSAVESIQMRRFSASGAPLAGQLQVNTYTTDRQRTPAVAVDPLGNFVVVWDSYGSFEDDDDRASIQGQRFASDGNPIGGEFQVNSYTTSYQVRPAIAMADDGSFVVVWDSYGSVGTDDYISVQGQLHDPDGLPIGGQFQVNSYTTNIQRFAAVASEPNGDFVVVWESYGSLDGDPLFSIQGQRFDGTPLPVGAEFHVNTYTAGSQRFPAVAVDATGGFVVAWASYGSNGDDTDSSSVQLQRYDSAGNAQGGEVQVNAYTAGFQGFPAVAMDASGGFVVAWAGSGFPGGDDDPGSIQAQSFDAAGAFQGAELQVNTFTIGDQDYPGIAMNAEGQFVVVWQSSSSGEDSDDSIQVRPFTTLFADGFESGDTSAWSAVLP